MTPDQREDFEERAALVADGCNISQPEATWRVRSWWEQAERLDFTDRGAQQTANSHVYTSSQNRIVGSFYGKA